MTYEYLCERCDRRFDVVKSVKEIDRSERCDSCEGIAKRQFSFRVHILGASVQHAEYNPAFGCVVKDKYHRAELAKRRGLVEIGNDFSSPDKIHKTYEAEREAKKEARYEQALKEIV